MNCTNDKRPTAQEVLESLHEALQLPQDEFEQRLDEFEQNRAREKEEDDNSDDAPE